MIEATQQPEGRLCTACFTGTYPVPPPLGEHFGKHLLEQDELPFDEPTPAVSTTRRVRAAQY